MGFTQMNSGMAIEWEKMHMGMIVLILATTSARNFATSQVTGMVNEYCQWDTFEANCKRGHVILIETARYGRMSMGMCVKKTNALGCAIPVLLFMDTQCSGRQECSLKVADIPQQGIVPCPIDYTSYLEASYTCLKVAVGVYHECRTNKFLKVLTPGGYISNTMNQASGLSAACPWRIQASPGQRINITLMDFSVFAKPNNSAALRQRMTFCRQYAVISEAGSRDTTICGGSEREKVAYISDGHVVDIKMFDYRTSKNVNDRVYFVIKHEALGCPSLTSPPNAELTKSGDSVTVTCKLSGEAWHLRCHKNTWIGAMGNCTRTGDTTLWAALTEEWSSPIGIVIVVGLGVGLGIIIGVCLLVTVLFVLKRRRWLQKREAAGMDRVHDEDDIIPPHVPADARVAMGMMQAVPEDAYAPSTWISQRPLPLPFMEDDMKRGSKDYQGSATFIMRQDSGGTITTVGKHPHNAGHIYESPKFGRKELMLHNQS